MRKISSYCLAVLLSTAANTSNSETSEQAAVELFASDCFSPYLTASKVAKAFALSGTTYDFYDLDPFSSAAPSPANKRPVTPGTDRRCEIAFPGDYARMAAQAAAEALQSEGITDPAPLPATFTETTTTTLLAARWLNPRRIAVVHVGTRDGTTGIETFMNVHRMHRIEVTQ